MCLHETGTMLHFHIHLSLQFFIQAKMASFIRLKQQNSDQLMASLFQATVLAESAREEETRAACTIQAAARMVQHRWDYLLTKVAVIKIQKIYRSVNFPVGG